MEIACGEYGDVVPKLVVAAQSDNSVKFRNECSSEIKPINCDKSVAHCAVMDAKNLLQDSININNTLSPGYSELLSVEKLEHDVGTGEINDQFSSPWKTMNIFSSDTTIASSKPVSILAGFSSMCSCNQAPGASVTCHILSPIVAVLTRPLQQ